MATLVKRVDVSDVIKDCRLYVKITGVTKFQLRLKAAMVFFKIGAWVAGVGIKIDEGNKC